MTVKEKFFIIWVFVVILISFVMRHFWSGAAYFAEHAVAFAWDSMPGLTHFLAGHFR